MMMTVYGGTPILHDDTQNLKGALVFADPFFRCKIADIKLDLMFLLNMSNLITVIYIIEGIN